VESLKRFPSGEDPSVLSISPDARMRPAHASDVAQAHVFVALMQSEIKELKALMASAEKQWRRRCDRGLDDAGRPPEALMRLRRRVAEAQSLLANLRDRFAETSK
jgi:outer membrane protein TolC